MARTLATAPRSTASSSISASINISSRAASTANLSSASQFFVRYTIDDADQRLPLDYPQFPRAFVSRNQFVTTELKQAYTSNWLATYRAGYSRTRVGQDVEANTTLPPFVPGREFIGNIDVGGLQRFGTQSSVDVRFLQQVTSLQGDLVWNRGRHLLGAGALAERYQQDMVNPTFSLGTYRVRQPARVSGEPAHQLHRPDTGGAVRSPVAVLDRRRLRAGRVPGPPAPHGDGGPALRIHDDADRHRRSRFGA